MKQIRIIFLILWLIWGTPIPGATESICSHVDIEWASKHIPLPRDAKVVLKKEKEQLCEVILRVEGNLVPVYAGKNFILAGQLFKDGRSITRDSMAAIPDKIRAEQNQTGEKNNIEKARLEAFFKEKVKTLAEFVFLSFKPNQTDGFIYVVTDPACPHCKDLLLKLKPAALEARVEIRVITYPILGPRSRDMAVHAICNQYSYQDYTRIKMDEPGDSCNLAEVLLKKTVQFFRSADLTFVPLVIAGDGSWIVDTNDIAKIREHLGVASEKGDGGSGGVCVSDPAH
ncbi:MAG: hypothetical protein K8S13_05655 [Desulfobacula sp.]|uniref:hypothetical protein n=1 Tax=Desulfobacula sp. TaxID=2593537 RepID=UPI0025B8D0F2|nr:hypothetical protein [Desulfobacula sp.]MCD4719330.1 hypothetical protein [Desulfobacula sp.]